jgi:predicted  nucleic acid-binding Zn ribbon protein
LWLSKLCGTGFLQKQQLHSCCQSCMKKRHHACAIFALFVFANETLQCVSVLA